MRTAVVPLDLHESDETVARLLRFLASLGFQSVRLIHIAGSEPTSRKSAPRLEALSSRVRPDELEISIQVLIGSPAIEILQGAFAYGADAVALPWKRKNWLQRSLVGSVTRDILRMNDRSTLVFRPGNQDTATTTHIVYATDFGAADDVAIPLLAERLSSTKRLEIIHADERAPDPEAETKRKAAVAHRLKEISDSITRGDVRLDQVNVELVDRVGKARREVVKFVSSRRPDLVIVGKSGTRRENAVLGSVAEEIAYRASSSVLVVPPKG